MNSRSPAVAGTFYPGTETALNRELDKLMPSRGEKVKAIGVISPHAGYIYSGEVAGETLSSVVVPQKIILLGPNHTGLGAGGAVMNEGRWRLPNGEVAVDYALAGKLLNRSDLLTIDVMAHLREHSIEVQIPFLLHERKDISIVPITLMGLSIEDCREIGTAIAETIRSSDEDILVVASSDMTHYESQDSAGMKDQKAIEKILELDPAGLMDVVRENRISMCGVIPATIMLFAAIQLGAKRASLIRYSTSGDVSGDYEQVVGYAGIVVE